MADESQDWSELRFRHARNAEPTAEDNASARFAIGLAVFIGVALVYPWYSYWVQSRLLGRELQESARQLEDQTRDELREFNAQMQQSAQRREAAARRHRIDAVQLVGASMSGATPVVVVKLGTASVVESSPVICRQAASWLGRSTTGMRLRVQAHRGNAPAVDVGVISC